MGQVRVVLPASLSILSIWVTPGRGWTSFFTLSIFCYIRYMILHKPLKSLSSRMPSLLLSPKSFCLYSIYLLLPHYRYRLHSQRRRPDPPSGVLSHPPAATLNPW